MSDEECLAVIAHVAESLVFLMPIGAAENTPNVWRIQIEVQWIGPDGSSGRIMVALDQGAAEATAANLLGLMPGETLSLSDIPDAANELANVIAGNLLPILYGKDHEFHLSPPEARAPKPLYGRTIVMLALVEGTIGVSIEGDADNTKILKAVQVPKELRA
jgi:CheY-specific phosphatase CheX